MEFFSKMAFLDLNASEEPFAPSGRWSKRLENPRRPLAAKAES
jgi:hypothetical protein